MIIVNRLVPITDTRQEPLNLTPGALKELITF
jgi:hypothetical protein